MACISKCLEPAKQLEPASLDCFATVQSTAIEKSIVGRYFDIPPKMNSGVVKHTRLREDCMENSSEFSPPESKRICLDDGSNNNLSSTLNGVSKNGARWSCTGDTSLVQPEILEDMGVSMLEDEAISCESIKKLSSEECTISPTSSDSSRLLSGNENKAFGSQSSMYRGSSFDTVSMDRLERDPYELEDAAVYLTTVNESGYSSRIEADTPFCTLGDAKESFNNDTINESTDKKSTMDQFYLYRRKRVPSVMGEDKFNTLSDEMILMILKWLPKKFLVRSMLVCKRWCQIARDEVLWSRLDLGSKVLNEGTLGHILHRGVQILRLAQAEIADPVFHKDSDVFNNDYVCKLLYLDLSMAVISPTGLASLLNKCKYLKKLSLEKCTLNGSCCKAIRENEDLEALNLTMCEGLDVECVKELVKLRSLSALNIAWCSWDVESMTLLCKSLPPSVVHLNLAGCRKTMTDDNVKDLVSCCPNIMELDLSDCTMLTTNTIHSLLKLSKLEHLSVSRCYSIPPPTYLRLAHMPCLSYLDVFGLMSEQMLKSLQVHCGKTEINKFLYSSVARPTVGVRRTSIWGLRVRD